MISTLLEAEGYGVRWARTAVEALPVIEGCVLGGGQEGCPDVAHVDLSLPNLEAAGHLREALSDSASPPVVVVSA